MTEGWTRVRAVLRLLTQEAGGRSVAIPGGASYRPIHDFGLPSGGMAMGFIDLPQDKDWLPGQSIEADLDLSNWPELESELVVGRVWKIREGRQIVGSGVILERLD